MKLKPGISAIIPTLLLSLALAGCGSGGNGTPTTSHTLPPTTTPTPTDAMNFPDGAYMNTTILSGGIMRVSWTNTDDTISIGIKAKTTGWVAIALSPTLSKTNADLIIGAVVGGELTLNDSFDPGYAGNHPRDTAMGGTYDLFDVKGGEADGVTTIEFKRRLNTGDKYDVPFVNGTNSYLFALGPDDTMISEHSLIGMGQITITLTHP